MFVPLIENTMDLLSKFGPIGENEAWTIEVSLLFSKLRWVRDDSSASARSRITCNWFDCKSRVFSLGMYPDKYNRIFFNNDLSESMYSVGFWLIPNVLSPRISSKFPLSNNFLKFASAKKVSFVNTPIWLLDKSRICNWIRFMKTWSSTREMLLLFNNRVLQLTKPENISRSSDCKRLSLNSSSCTDDKPEKVFGRICRICTKSEITRDILI